jgi:hypothetical protein
MNKLVYKKLSILLGATGLLGGLAGCGSLEKDVNVPLPYYANQLVTECYLENGVVPRLTVTESVPYLDDGQAAAAGSFILKLPGGQSVQLPIDVSVKLVLPTGPGPHHGQVLHPHWHGADNGASGPAICAGCAGQARAARHGHGRSAHVYSHRLSKV